MSSQSASGSCFCGTVQFHFDLPTLWCAHCHCSMCRRTHGAAFVTWVGVDANKFTVSQGADKLVRFKSSAEAVRSFCQCCGSTLLFESTKWPGQVHVVLANINTPIDREPNAHAFWDDHVDWASWEGKTLRK